MSVYVDDMRAPVKRGGRTYILCHMIADTPEELRAMGQRIGVPRAEPEYAGTYREHYDVCLSKRRRAVEAGAIEITQLALGRKLRARKEAPC